MLQSQNVFKADGNRISLALRYKPESNLIIFKNLDAGIFIDGFVNQPNNGYRAYYSRDSLVLDTTCGFPFYETVGYIYHSDSTEKWNNARNAYGIAIPLHRTFYFRKGYFDIGFQLQYMFFSEIPYGRLKHFVFDVNVDFKIFFIELILKYKNMDYRNDVHKNRSSFYKALPREINLGATNLGYPGLVTHLPANADKPYYFSYFPDYYYRYFEPSLLLHVLSKKETDLDVYGSLLTDNMTIRSKEKTWYYKRFDPRVCGGIVGIRFIRKKLSFNIESFIEDCVAIGFEGKYRMTNEWDFSIQLPSLITIDCWYKEINHVGFGAEYRF